MHQRNIIFIASVVLFWGGRAEISVNGQKIIPDTPCPEVFQYYTQPDGTVYGRIMIPYDGSSDIHLGVNASMKGYYTDNNQVKLRIKMVTPGMDLIQRSTRTVNYDMFFPFQNVIPKITRIEYNHKPYCSGPPEELIPGTPGVTSLWSGHNYFFQAPNRNPSFAPSELPVLPVFPENDNEKTTEVATNQRPPEVTITPRPVSVNRTVECGVSKNVIVPLILGGQDINDGLYPWLVAMFTASGNGYEYKCTANLISNRHVVTAARCVNFFKTQIVQTEDILLIFGTSNLKNWATKGAVIRGAAAVHTNPDFNANSGHGDITVITLDKPVEFSRAIAPICLWEGDNSLDDLVNKTGTVAGWGADEGAQKSGKFSTALAKSVDMPVVSQDSCLFSNLTYFQLTSDITFCAGKRDGTGICIGDSGAGFMMNKNGKYYLRGLASIVLSEKGKCDLTNYMVFCDAAKLTDWIRESMSI